jgi:pimeloyl-ACP methyl ester carboxylesterase
MYLNNKKTVVLRDGRLLGYSEFGDSDGKPLLFFSGYPGTRTQGELLDKESKKLGIKIICPDRPGIGFSEFKKDRCLCSWADDTAELMDSLNISRCPIAGYSAGGPYAAACGYKIPERISSLGIISGIAPVVKGVRKGILRFFTMGYHFPDALKLSLEAAEELARTSPHKILSAAERFLSEPDKLWIYNPEVSKVMIEMLLEAFREGVSGAELEAELCVKPWGFEPSQIGSEVHLWHGKADRVLPVSMGKYMADRMPKCDAVFLPDEGHISLFMNYRENILKILCSIN